MLSKKIKKKLIIGTAQFSSLYGITNLSKITSSEINGIFKLCEKNFITDYDTAFEYSNHKYFKKNNTHTFNLSTKISNRDILSKTFEKNITIKIINQIRDLKIKYIRYLLIHSPEELKKKDFIKAMNFIKLLKELGLVKKVGYSVYSKKKCEKLIKYAIPDVIQLPINLINNSFTKDSFLKKIKKNKIEIHARSIFLQGLLLSNTINLPRKFKRYNSYWINFEKEVKKYSITKLNACLSHVLSYQEVDKVVMGINSLDHLKEILNIKKLSNYQIKSFQKLRNDEKLTNIKLW